MYVLGQLCLNYKSLFSIILEKFDTMPYLFKKNPNHIYWWNKTLNLKIKGSLMTTQFVNKSIESIEADLTIVLVVDGEMDTPFVKAYKKFLQKLGFKGSSDEQCFLCDIATLFIGIDDLQDKDLLRAATAQAVQFSHNKGFKSLKIALYDTSYEGVKAFVEGFYLGNYCFETYKSEETKRPLKEIFISAKSLYGDKKIDLKMANEALDEATKRAKATNFTRDIVNQTPEHITPKSLAKIAKKMAKKYNLTANILRTKDMEKRKMGAFLAVARASCHDPRLIHLSYRPKQMQKRIILVGKGLTYDSGGLSLKPADFMVTMKCDKAGACAVLGIMKGVCEMGLPIGVDVIIGAAENMVDGSAYKPDDVLKASNGTTIEVRNTDAEGRLVLSDCLCYAQEEIKKFDYILDYATLTGACVVGLGEYTSGVMGHNATLKRSFEEAGEVSGDLMNPLHFNRHLAKLIKSEIADVCNVSSTRYGGALTAGLFLDHFIKEENKQKWLHIDIAGPSYVEKKWDYNPFGATGAGVRATLTWIKQLLEKK